MGIPFYFTYCLCIDLPYVFRCEIKYISCYYEYYFWCQYSCYFLKFLHWKSFLSHYPYSIFSLTNLFNFAAFPSNGLFWIARRYLRYKIRFTSITNTSVQVTWKIRNTSVHVTCKFYHQGSASFITKCKPVIIIEVHSNPCKYCDPQFNDTFHCLSTE